MIAIFTIKFYCNRDSLKAHYFKRYEIDPRHKLGILEETMLIFAQPTKL